MHVYVCVWLAACYQFRELTVHWWKIWVQFRAELDVVVVIFSISFWLFLSEKRISSALEGRLRSGRANCLHLEERSDSTTKDDDDVDDDARLPIVASQTDGQTRLAGTVYLFFLRVFFAVAFPASQSFSDMFMYKKCIWILHKILFQAINPWLPKCFSICCCAPIPTHTYTDIGPRYTCNLFAAALICDWKCAH